MTEFLAIVLSFPTVIFTVPLVVAAAYWALAVVGAVDIEALDGDGALEGALDALDGAADAVDGAADAVDGAVEAGDASVEAAAKSTGGVLVWLASALRLRRVPLTVSLSLLALWGWIAAFVLTWLAAGSILAFFGAFVLAVVATNVTARPFEPIFRSHQGRDRRSLVGEVCDIQTNRVDDRFGQATAMVGADDLVFQVRCDTPDNGLARGGKALIVHYDEQREAFVVEPLATSRAEGAERIRVPATTSQREA